MATSKSRFTVRAATVSQSDHEFFIDCKDSQMKWLPTVGSGKQWTDENTRESDVDWARELIESSETAVPWGEEGWCRTYVAETDTGSPVGMLVLESKAPKYVGSGLTEQNAKDPFIFLTFMMSNRGAGDQCKGSGAALIDFTKELALKMGIRRVCLDCWRGNDRKLVKYYERQGFVFLNDFDDDSNNWRGSVLEIRF